MNELDPKIATNPKIELTKQLKDQLQELGVIIQKLAQLNLRIKITKGLKTKRSNNEEGIIWDTTQQLIFENKSDVKFGVNVQETIDYAAEATKT